MSAGTQHLNREHSHLPFLDGLRGLMAFWVLAGHALYVTGNTLSIVSRQQLAVDVFMFVSGFLMAYYFRVRQDKEPWETPGTWRTFYVRRFFRIAPAYYLCLLLAWVLQPWLRASISQIIATFWPDQMPEMALLAPVNWKDILAHLSFTFGLIPKYASSNALSDWSIGLEMQFYLAFPFIMLLYRRAGYIFSTALLVAIWVAATHLVGVYLNHPAKLLGHFPQPTFLPLRLHQFVIGIVLAECLHLRDRDPRKSRWLFVLAFGLALATSSKILAGVVSLSALLLIYRGQNAPAWARLALNWTQRLFDSKACRFLADTSYGVYLFQNLIILPLGAWWILHPGFLPMSARAKSLAVLCVVGAIVYPMSYLVHRFVERPGIKLGKQFLRHRRNQTAKAEAGLNPGLPATLGDLGT